MDLCVLIADSDGVRGHKIEKEIRHLALVANIQKMGFFNCNKINALEELQKKQWQMLNMAFVSLNFEDAKDIGDKVYQNNPSCRLIYYSEDEALSKHLLPTRPVWYWDCRDWGALNDIFSMQMELMKMDPYFFYYSDRMRSLAVPVDSILYAYSLKRAVYLHTETEELGPIPRRLDEVQEMLPKHCFTRVHQSFIVNNNCVRSLDKSTKSLCFINNEEVPVSRAFYERARAIFCQNDSFSD